MANLNSTLLTTEERRILYGAPALDDIERIEYFNFTDDEIKMLNSVNGGIKAQINGAGLTQYLSPSMGD